MTQVISSADVKATKANITSANVVVGKRSYHEKGDMQLESLTQSNTCFNDGCGGTSSPVSANCNPGTDVYLSTGCGSPSYVQANCNPGTYVYQITGYTGFNAINGLLYVSGFDIVCSDGYTASIGEPANFRSVTISNRQGYT